MFKLLRFVVLPIAVGLGVYLLANPLRGTLVERDLPLPYHIPKHAGNLTLRLAMVHDVIHDRYARHGPDYYRQRNQDVLAALKNLDPARKGEADRYFQLQDDLGVGLEFLGRHEEAVALMRKKWSRQIELGCQGRELYSTCANLGTFLILWQLSEGFGDAAGAKKRIAESIGWIRKAVEYYPESHFGRENWQLVLEEFLLAAIDDPWLLAEFDMVGNRLGQTFHPSRRHLTFDEKRWLELDALNRPLAEKARRFLQNDGKFDPLDIDAGLTVTALRNVITKVGADEGWSRAGTSLKEPVPFDEPVLGIIGMWRMGAGANPHFALALGQIMELVGQRHIAWSALERAQRLQNGFSRDPAICGKLADRCRELQEVIAMGSLEDNNREERTRRFDQDLSNGQAYQKAYVEYEAKMIAAGVSLDDPHFYDAFESAKGPIATPVGKEEKVYEEVKHFSPLPTAGLPVFLGGLALLATAALRPRKWFRASGRLVRQHLLRKRGPIAEASMTPFDHPPLSFR